ncbi:MAG: hypothetical protein AAF629_25825, partial [Chloroflexota bacterium]
MLPNLSINYKIIFVTTIMAVTTTVFLVSSLIGSTGGSMQQTSNESTERTITSTPISNNNFTDSTPTNRAKAPTAVISYKTADQYAANSISKSLSQIPETGPMKGGRAPEDYWVRISNENYDDFFGRGPGFLSLGSLIFRLTVITDGDFSLGFSYPNSKARRCYDPLNVGNSSRHSRFFDLKAGQATKGAEGIMVSINCRPRFDIIEATSDWELILEPVVHINPHFGYSLVEGVEAIDIAQQYRSQEGNEITTIGPVSIPEGSYKVTLVTEGDFLVKLNSLGGYCEDAELYEAYRSANN